MEGRARHLFPYRLPILKGQEPWLSLRVRNRWPAANRTMFCFPEKERTGPRVQARPGIGFDRVSDD
jgi:hypothetical protein